MTHELKIWPQYFERVKDGSKTFEYRNDDRGFQMGDTVVLNEWDPHDVNNSYKGYDDLKRFTGNKLKFKIGYVLPIGKGHVVFSLLPLEES